MFAKRSTLRKTLNGGAIVAMVLTGTAHLASADVLTTGYDATKCRADRLDLDGTSVLQRTTGKIKNVSTDTQTIHCPITKKTSAPGITNDKFGYADVPVQTTGGTVWCKVNTWESNVQTNANNQPLPNLKHSEPPVQTTSAKTIRVNAASDTPSGYWDQAGTSPPPPSPAWFYLDLICSLAPGTSITNYSINEKGTDQTTFRLYPALSCALDASSDIAWQNLPFNNQGQTLGGYVMGQAGLGTKFAMKCPVPANSLVDVAMGPAIGNNPAGCNLNNANFSSFAWNLTTSLGDEWPSEVLRGFTQPVIEIPVSNGGPQDNLLCGDGAPQGDSKVLSYRTKPTSARGAWTTSASDGANTNNVKDNNGSTRWTTGKNGASGMWFQVNLGTSRTVNQVTMDSGTSTNDFAHSYDVYGFDGSSWFLLGSGTGTSRFVSISFAEEYIQAVKVQLTSNLTHWWSIHELNIYDIYE